jgi:O-antigen ligase
MFLSRNIKWYFFHAAVFGVIGYGVLLTGSRGSMLALGLSLALAVLGLLVSQRKLIWQVLCKIREAVAIAFLVVVVGGAVLLLPTEIRTRLFAYNDIYYVAASDTPQTTKPVAPSDTPQTTKPAAPSGAPQTAEPTTPSIDLNEIMGYSPRFAVWNASFHAAQAHLIRGHGAGASIPTMADYIASQEKDGPVFVSHNNFLFMLLEYGMIGLFLFLLLLAPVLVQAVWKGRIYLLAIISSALVTGMLLDSSKEAFFWVALTAAFLISKYLWNRKNLDIRDIL